METKQLKSWLGATAWGDQTAFAALYQATAPYLLSLAIRIVRHRELAEEVLQEAFIQIWYSAGDYHAAKGQPSAWLAGIVRHRALDAMRREGSQRSRLQAAALQPEPDPLPDVENTVRLSAELKALLVCLRPLQSNQRQSILLAYYYGYSHSEVASRLRQPLGTIKTWIRRGIVSVRECLRR